MIVIHMFNYHAYVECLTLRFSSDVSAAGSAEAPWLFPVHVPEQFFFVNIKWDYLCGLL